MAQLLLVEIICPEYRAKRNANERDVMKYRKEEKNLVRQFMISTKREREKLMVQSDKTNKPCKIEHEKSGMC
jgi:hypothetical protein